MFDPTNRHENHGTVTNFNEVDGVGLLNYINIIFDMKYFKAV